eukprot:m.4061 g.4061  ORF g.4061 m.4061 type:complete len:263 (+) comp3794_c0_seq1:79-867(+)
MTSIGTGYDLSAQTFSPAGKVFQIDYAMKAVDNSSTAIAIRGIDGVVFASENTIKSKLHESKTIQRAFGIDRHIGMLYCGRRPDGHSLAKEGRSSATKFRDLYGHPISVSKLNDELGAYMHYLTLHGGARPFGCCVVIGGYNPTDGAELFMAQPSGESWGYYACAMGKNKQPAQAELEKLKPTEMTCRELIKEAARIIYATHDDLKDKEFELELAWVCAESNGKFEHVSSEVHEEASSFAKEKMEEESDDSDSDDDDDEEED